MVSWISSFGFICVCLLADLVLSLEFNGSREPCPAACGRNSVSLSSPLSPEPFSRSNSSSSAAGDWLEQGEAEGHGGVCVYPLGVVLAFLLLITQIFSIRSSEIAV